jgi:hypothetical protein
MQGKTRRASLQLVIHVRLKHGGGQHMSSSTMTRAIGIIMIAIVAAAVACPASAASDRAGKFSPANSPQETVYRPECRIVQIDGSWLPSRRVECAW